MLTDFDTGRVFDTSPEFHLYMEGHTDQADDATALRQEPIAVQAECAEWLLGPEGLKYPNYKALSHLLVTVNNLPLLAPPQQPDLDLIQLQVDRYSNSIGKRRIPIKVVNEEEVNDVHVAKLTGKRPHEGWFAQGFTLGLVCGSLPSERRRQMAYAHDLAHDFTYDAVGRPDWALAGRVPEGAGTAAVSVADRAITWMMVADLMSEVGYRKGNPYLRLLDIFNMGCWPMGPMIEDRRTKFAVYVPTFQVGS